jgi:TFIIF-interacting CTD phosphatase-like protein
MTQKVRRGTKKKTTKRKIKVTEVQGKPLIVLDIDETLISSLKEEEEGYTDRMDYQDMDKYFRVFFRPYYRVFLQFLSQNFKEIGIWSAGTKSYVDFIVKILEKSMNKKFKFVWTINECKKSMSKYNVTKALELLEGYPDVIMIDDNPEIKERYPKQTIRVRPYEMGGDNGYDEELLRILKKMKEKEKLSSSISSFSLSEDEEPNYTE